MLPSLLRSLGVMAAGLVVCGGLVAFVVSKDLPWLSLLWIAFMVLAGAVTAVGRARLGERRFVLPVFVSSLLTVVVVALYFLFLVMGVRTPFEARWLVPVCGLFAGAVSHSNGKALGAYYHGLLHHHQLYDYLLGNGATHHEAVAWFVRRALHKTMLPFLSRMAALMVPLTAVPAWTLVMAGVPVFQAFLFQGLLLIATLSASMASLWLSLTLARRYSFDGYDKFAPPAPAPSAGKKEEQPAPTTTAEPEQSATGATTGTEPATPYTTDEAETPEAYNPESQDQPSTPGF